LSTQRPLALLPPPACEPRRQPNLNPDPTGLCDSRYRFSRSQVVLISQERSFYSTRAWLQRNASRNRAGDRAAALVLILRCPLITGRHSLAPALHPPFLPESILLHRLGASLCSARMRDAVQHVRVGALWLHTGVLKLGRVLQHHVDVQELLAQVRDLRKGKSESEGKNKEISLARGCPHPTLAFLP
jgi:hypothetical protein